jgi:2-iminoacetate synthase
MSFYYLFKQYSGINFEKRFSSVNEREIKRIINKESINREDFLKLISPKSQPYLELMAQKAKKLSMNHFGKAVTLYTPMYLSNYCNNKCVYCSFNANHEIRRRRLTEEEIVREGDIISQTGLKHLLILTGSSRQATSVKYIKRAVELLKDKFESIAIEIYPLHRSEYKQLIEAGVDGLTIYQEVYNEEQYKKVHPSGPKMDYIFRLNAPESACQEKMSKVNIGALLGLHDIRKEVFYLGLHGEYLSKKYPEVEMSFSLPRIKKAKGSHFYSEINNRDFVQLLLALRIFLPYFSINISTREDASFRRHLLHLGVNKMSAGVSTAVGGHIDEKGETQFEIDDHGSVENVKKMIKEAGYQPVMKDWVRL